MLEYLYKKATERNTSVTLYSRVEMSNKDAADTQADMYQKGRLMYYIQKLFLKQIKDEDKSIILLLLLPNVDKIIKMSENLLQQGRAMMTKNQQFYGLTYDDVVFIFDKLRKEGIQFTHTNTVKELQSEDAKKVWGYHNISSFYYFHGCFLYLSSARESTSNNGSILRYSVYGLRTTYVKIYLDRLVADIIQNERKERGYWSLGAGSQPFLNVLPSTSPSSLIMDEETKEILLRHIMMLKTNIFKTKSNIARRSKLVILLEGPPGTGKTTTIQVIANLMKSDVAAIHPSSDLTIPSFKSLLSEARKKGQVIAIEEFDHAMDILCDKHQGNSAADKAKKDMENMMIAGKMATASGVPPQIQAMMVADVMAGEKKTSAPAFHIGTLLDTLDGLSSLEGTVVVLTTNNYVAMKKKFPKSVFRPGRIDLRVSFCNCTKDAAYLLCQKVYKGLVEMEKPEQLTYNGYTVDIPKYTAEEINEFAKRFSDYLPEGKLSISAVENFLVSNLPSYQVTLEKLEDFCRKNSDMEVEELEVHQSL